MNVGICHNSDRKYCMWPFGPRIFRDEGDAPNEILRPSLHAPNGSQIINFACRHGFSHPEPARHFLQTPRAEAREKKRYRPLRFIASFLFQCQILSARLR
ncbi:hypothetical protein AVEN_123147-1 [Araneus ventricosus]|uniref:Uncharacterized protein n=1 Tax=Araneus ventricosus TaxID=182803 RepID=A0A4Y2SQB3_ARAVE|nr:hypothetical protein AVEN_98423-1 [Araneus ventricosus]GBO08874.1 hypothetical protein AVEN_123147-1 [Araneus ventricosus]